jgi:hypothetical protein
MAPSIKRYLVTIVICLNGPITIEEETKKDPQGGKALPVLRA